MPVSYTHLDVYKRQILDIMPGGTRKVEFHYNGIFNEILDQIGLMPLPPVSYTHLIKNSDIMLRLRTSKIQ